MGGLASLAVRSLAARRGRTLLSMAGVALGVGVLFATLTTDAGIEASIERTVRDLVGRADLRVEAFRGRTLSPASVAAIEAAPGVVVAAPVLERRTYPAGAVDDPDPLPEPVVVLGVDPDRDTRVREQRLLGGEPLAGSDEFAALVTERLAAEDNLRVGSDIRLQAGEAQPVPLRIAGIIEGDGPFTGSAGRTVIVPLRTGQRLFGQDGASRVDLVIGEGTTPTEVASALEVALTSEPYVLSSPGQLASSLRAATADFRATTALIAAVALFVGAFLILNTLSMTVLERVREIGLLRAAGATRRQAAGFVLVQGAVLGAGGTIVGLAVGAYLGELMAVSVRAIGTIPFERIELPVLPAALAVGIGLFVTLAASAEPARRAAGIPPVEALKPGVESPAARRTRLGWLVGVFSVVGLAGLVIWPRESGLGGLAQALAVYALFLLAVVLAPYLLVPLARFAGLPFSWLYRLEERLARASLARDGNRTALTVAALTIGLAMVVAVGGVAAGSRSTAAAWLAEVIPGNEVLTSIRPASIDEPAIQDLNGIDGVERVSPIALFEVALEGVRTDAAAMVGADLLADGRLRFIDGDRDTALHALDAGGATILPHSIADRLDLGVGGSVTLPLGDGRELALQIVGVAARTLPGRAGEALLVGWDDATTALGVTGADAFAVRYEPAGIATARPQVAATATAAALEVTPLSGIAGAVDVALGRVFGLLDALAVVAVVIAGLGIVNTLTMSVLERVREIGVLRAAGMTSRQIRRTVVVEAGIIGLAGSILGILTGLAVAGLLVGIAGGGLRLVTDPPWTSILVALGLGVGLSMVAAWYPARLASRLDIVRAVRHE